jgi:prolyl-tRNA editing enzyme YbaK/EbsC (Cys-tRNA(Pro) deacylase)
LDYGGVTRHGLAKSYPLLIDSRVAEMKRLITGGGFRKSKLSLSGRTSLKSANAVVAEESGEEI